MDVNYFELYPNHLYGENQLYINEFGEKGVIGRRFAAAGSDLSSLANYALKSAQIFLPHDKNQEVVFHVTYNTAGEPLFYQLYRPNQDSVPRLDLYALSTPLHDENAREIPEELRPIVAKEMSLISRNIFILSSFENTAANIFNWFKDHPATTITAAVALTYGFFYRDKA